MTIFSTNRSNPKAKLDSLLETARVRKDNLKSLREQMEADKAVKDLETSIDNIDKPNNEDINNEREKRRQRVATESINRKLGLLENRLIKKGIAEIRDMVLFEMTYKAFWLDDVLKESAIGSLYNTYKSVMEILDNLNIKKTSCINESVFLKNMDSKIAEVVEQAAKRITTESKDKYFTNPQDVDKIDFSLSDVEDEELTNDLSELGKEEIEDLVKQKVLRVINDEQIANKEMQAMLDEIDRSVSEAELEMNEKTDDVGDEETENDTSDQKAQSPTKESFDLMVARRKRSKLLNGSYGGTLFESIMVHNLNQINKTAVTEGVNPSYNDKMSATFNSSVYVYTVLETVSTLGLYNFDRIATKKLADYFKKVK